MWDDDRWERRRERWERRREWRRARMHSPGKHLATGLIFVALGAIFLLGNMGYIDVREYLAYWPVILIVLGVVRIVESRGDDYGHTSGMFWITIGLLFLLGSLGVLRVAFRDLWPILLIGVGVLMLWRSVLMSRERSRLRNPNAPPLDSTQSQSQSQADAQSSSFFSATAILGGVERRINSQDFQGGDVTAVLGGANIDLRGASIVPPRQAVLQVSAVFGGIEIRIPDDWTVVSELEVILGGFDDKKTDPPKDESKRLVVRGTVLFGGVEVRN